MPTPDTQSQNAGTEPTPPLARSVPHVHTVHGESRIDEYHWLRNREDPQVLAYLEAENRYTEAIMRRTETLQERLYQELRGRIKEADLSVPVPWNAWLYYDRTETGAAVPDLLSPSEGRRQPGRDPAGPQPARGRARLFPDGRLRGQP